MSPLFGRRRGVFSITLVLLIAVAAASVAVVRHRGFTALGDRLRQRAAADGVTLRFGSVGVGLRGATLRDVEVTFVRAPGLKVTADEATVRPGSTGGFEVALGRTQVALDPPALAAVGELARSPLWRDLALSWSQLSVTHTNRLTGPVQLTEVTVEPRPASTEAVVLHAGRVTLGTRQWSDVVITVQARGQMVELGLGAATVRGAPVVVGVFPSQGGAWGFVATVTHPPLPVLARAFGVALGPEFAAARVGGSFSFTIADDVSRPPTGRFELLVSGWPAPADADAAAVLGSTIGLGVRVTPGSDRSRVALENARMSTSLFSLGGTGSLGLGADLPLTLDLTGQLTCAQIRGNLRPSAVLDAVSAYLGPATDSDDGARNKARTAVAARLRETVTMRIQLEAALSGSAPPRLAWRMAPGCGFAGFTFGAFTSAPAAAAK